MYTISQHVKAVVDESPLIQDILSLQLGNNSQIARHIQPEVEKRTMETVSIHAITMALHRLTNKLKRKTVGYEFLREMKDITVRSNITEFIFNNSIDSHTVQADLQDFSKQNPGFYFTFIQGLYETIVLVPNEYHDDICTILNSVHVTRTLPQLSLITIRLPEDSLAIPGVYYPILQALAHKGINFIEIISVSTELSILFNESDVTKAFATIKKLTN